ncbi:MAG: tetratricopeptide (TPR) repeat protein [Myxococcota bacterium]|jgi:tetratricopeptide (TPR) repeat protein
MIVLALVGRVGIPAVHLCVAVFHVISAVALLRLLRPLPAALPAAVLFAVHPAASEVLGWASALPDAMAVSLGLLAALTGGPLVAGAVTLCALLAKESALLILPALVLARLAPRRLLPGWLGAVMIWGALRLLSGAGADWSWADRLQLVPAAILWPLSTMIIPHPLTAVRDLLAVSIMPTVLGAGVAVAGLILGRRSRAALVGFGLALAAAAIALPPTLDGYLAAERYAYVGLVGLAVWVAALLPAVDWRLGGGVVVASLGLHLHHSARWSADVPLFAAATTAMPESSYAWHLLGHALALEGQMSEAADAFGEAIATGHPYPDDRQLHLIALVQAGRAQEALEWAESSPQDGLTADWIAWWARAAHDTGDNDRAIMLIGQLYDGREWDGPDWVPELAAELQPSP